MNYFPAALIRAVINPSQAEEYQLLSTYHPLLNREIESATVMHFPIQSAKKQTIGNIQKAVYCPLLQLNASR